MSDPGIKIHHLARNERPMCEDCQKQMWLLSIKPGDLAFEVRTYECSGCAASKTLLVKNRLSEPALVAHADLHDAPDVAG